MPSPSITPPDVAEQFSAKMSSLHSDAIEKEIALRAQALGVPYLDLRKFHVAQEVLQMIPENIAQSFQIVPVILEKNILKIGAINLEANRLIDYLTTLKDSKRCEIELHLISPESLQNAMRGYQGLPKLKPISTGVDVSSADIAQYADLVDDFKKLADTLKKANLTEVINILIAGALKLNASDIHVEAEEKGILVRYRLDGVLHEISEISHDLWKQLIARLKLIAKLKLNINSEPQDGRFTINLENDQVDVRVSTIPTAWGESVVMRLLRSSATGLQFQDLGLRGRAYDILKQEVMRPNGMIITTGPTGSGKTTTLYAILNKLNDAETKIITLENPVEYKLKGINQSQIDHAAKYDFAKGLRAILRQDPDVVMVGEIRDAETADIAINAALTGHLVISTIHTNSAAGAIPRFVAMEVKPFLLAPALNCVIGQRLVRKICTQCKEEITLAPDILKKVQESLGKISTASGYSVDINNLHFYQGKGCAACHNLGYKGRIGIYEIMDITPEIEQLILQDKVSESNIEKLAIEQGMITMVQDGLLKALDSITSVEEVFTQAE